ncbi:hypothetical protein Q0N88_33390, partial [Bacillus thuringiensis]|uniref:hypothetical protein n=1 Tax=Bacillus thuringiensis TaxID=1428 RepID=UPI003458782C
IGYHTSKSVLSGDGLDYYHSSRKTDFFMHLFLDIYEFCNTLHVYNEHMSFIVSVPRKEDEYAERFAKRVAVDFYEYTEEQVENVTVEFIVSFWMESAINLNKLNKA